MFLQLLKTLMTGQAAPYLRQQKPIRPRAPKDPNSPTLATAIAKRERRAEKLLHDTFLSHANNDAHDARRALNPCYVAK